MRYPLLTAIKVAAKNRPAGYENDVMSHGQVMGAVLAISDEDYAMLCMKYGRIKIPSRGISRTVFHPLIETIAEIEDDTDLDKWIRSMAAQIQDRVRNASKKAVACGDRRKILEHAREQLEYFYEEYQTRKAG